MANAGSVVIRIDGDDSRFRKTLSGLGKATSAAVKGLTIAGGVLSAAWTAVGLTSVKYNAEIEQLETSFTVMTGSAEKATKVMERLRKLGASTPFATKDLAEATQLLMQYGMDADTAIDSMTMLGDISQGNAEKMMSIATAYGQMTSAGKVQLQDIKQMINAGFNPLLEISERTGESMESLYDRISKGTLAVDEITESMRRATSEGGKFFGSMEAQSQTVSGLISTLKDELATLGGDIFKPISESLRTRLLPEAINIVREMQDAYASGGVDGLTDSVVKEIPKLVNAATDALEKVAAKLKEKLPGIVKKLISALPSVLATSVDSILPTIVDTVFEIIAVAVEEIVGRLPELAPILLRGVGNLLESVFNGLLNVAGGLFSGIETALKKWGILAVTPMEAFEYAWEKTDTSKYKDIDVTVGVNITPEDYQAEIDAALSEVRTALENIPGLTEAQRINIENAIINGTGLQLLTDTLNSIGLPEGKAEEITSAITGAMNIIDSTLSDPEFGLDQAAIDNINEVIASGGDVQAALESYDVDPEAARVAAEKIDGAVGLIDTAVAGLGLDAATVRSIKLGAVQDKAAIEASLRLMEIDPAVIDPVLTSYDTVTGSLTAGIDGVYRYIADMFTDGVPESEEDVAKAEAAIRQYAQNAHENLDKWFADEIERLNKDSGLSGEALQAEIDRTTQTYNELSAEIDTTTNNLLARTESMVGKSTEYCEQQLAIMQKDVDYLKELSAQIDVLTNAQYDTSRTRRTLVKAGAVTNVEHQYEAIELTALELEQRLQEADATAAEAFEEAAVKFGTNSAEYAKEEARILDQQAKDKAAAYDIYNNEIEQIVSGIYKASPDFAAAFEKYNAEQPAVEMVTQLQNAIVDAANNAAITGEAIDPNVFIEGLQGIDLDVVAAKLGIDSGQLNTLIADALKSPSGDSALNLAMSDYIMGVETDLGAALRNAGLDVSTIPALKLAIENGYLKAAGDIDWTSIETLLATGVNSSVTNAASGLSDSAPEITASAEAATANVPSALDRSIEAKKSGMNTAKGVINGMRAMTEQVALAAASLGYTAVRSLRTAIQEGSPSKLTIKSGKNFGRGFALGINDEIANARDAAQRMADNALGALDGIGGRISVSQQINANGMASAFRNMLSSMTIATDSETPVQLFVNGRMIAETTRSDTRAVQSAFNTQLALGVGKR